MNIILTALVFLNILINPVLAAPDTSEFGQLHFLKGVAYIEDASGRNELMQGDLLHTGDTLTLEEGGLAIIKLHDGSSLRLGPDYTALKLQRHMLDDAANTGTKMILKAGALLIQAVKAIDDYISMEVEVSEQVSLGVRGTTLFVGVDEDDAMVSLKEGSVEVYQQGKDDHEPLAPGESMVVEEKKALTKPARFGWANKLNWSIDEKNVASGRVEAMKQFRQERRQEFLQQAPALRQRMQRPIMQKMQERKERLMARRQELGGQVRERMGMMRDQARQLGRPEMRQQMRQEMRQNMKQDRQQMRQEMKQERQQMREDRKEMRQEMRQDMRPPQQQPGMKGERQQMRQEQRQDRREMRHEQRQQGPGPGGPRGGGAGRPGPRR